jgi:hypothetical protein
MESTQPEFPQSAVTLVQAKRERAQHLWKLAIRAFALAFAIIGLGLQISIAARHQSIENDDSNNSDYYYYYSTAWFSPESFTFVSLLFHRAALHIPRLMNFELIAWPVNCLEWCRIHHSLHQQARHSPWCSCWT